MAKKYIFDACAIVAILKNENGENVVQALLDEAKSESSQLFMTKLNLYEVYYGICREMGVIKAEITYDMVLGLPISIIENISDNTMREAARFKVAYKMSLADSILLGEASALSAAVVTSDHHEFDIVDKNSELEFAWIR
ncbi:MAG: PIN domain-containing protein [Defluviitaleaceae bacterium]|nr:PIN domain-containing protein [Defluviitaleaceae bacterium]